MIRGIIAIALLVSAEPAWAVRLKELGHFDGVRKNQLIGYGLVVGLDGTGDTERAHFSPQSLEAMLSRLGVRVDKSMLVLRNIAAVTVTADLPAFARPGTTIDVQVSSIGDARSLLGGTLLMTPLKGANGETYALAQGPLSVGSETQRDGGGRRGRLNVGRVTGGGLVERDVPVTLGDKGVLTFMLAHPDFKTAANLAEAVNRALPRLVPGIAVAPAVQPGPLVAAVGPGAGNPAGDLANWARPVDGGTVEIAIPEGYAERTASFIALLETIEVEPDAVAKVVVSGSTGAVVLGGEVRLSQVAIAYEGVAIDIYDLRERAPPTDTLKIVPEGATLAEVVRSLNKLGVGARALVDILQALASAGALHAELEVVP